MVQAFAASANKIVTRYLKAENANVNLLYLGVVGVLGSAVACALLPVPITLPKSVGLTALLTGNGECAVLKHPGCPGLQPDLGGGTCCSEASRQRRTL